MEDGGCRFRNVCGMYDSKNDPLFNTMFQGRSVISEAYQDRMCDDVLGSPTGMSSFCPAKEYASKRRDKLEAATPARYSQGSVLKEMATDAAVGAAESL